MKFTQDSLALSLLSFYFFCSSLRPTAYTWKKKDGELPQLAKIEGAYLRFEMLNKSDNGVYLCQADNGIGNSQGEYTLLVQGKEHWGGLARMRDAWWERCRERVVFFFFMFLHHFFLFLSFVACTSIFFLF